LSDVVIVSERTHFLLHEQGLAVLENGLRDLVARVELVHEALACALRIETHNLNQ
jgi:hypothetical protein